jgi:hypothetical protein
MSHDSRARTARARTHNRAAPLWLRMSGCAVCGADPPTRRLRAQCGHAFCGAAASWRDRVRFMLTARACAGRCVAARASVAAPCASCGAPLRKLDADDAAEAVRRLLCAAPAFARAEQRWLRWHRRAARRAACDTGKLTSGWTCALRRARRRTRASPRCSTSRPRGTCRSSLVRWLPVATLLTQAARTQADAAGSRPQAGERGRRAQRAQHLCTGHRRGRAPATHAALAHCAPVAARSTARRRLAAALAARRSCGCP